jgi:hypothetical protein
LICRICDSELLRAFEYFFLESFKISASHSDFSRVVESAFSGDPGKGDPQITITKEKMKDNFFSILALNYMLLYKGQFTSGKRVREQ